MLSQAQRLLLAAVALRVVLVVLGAGHYLAFRVEVSTPANSLLSIREGVTLLQLGISPYSGSACHVPPLLLWLLAPTASHTHLYALPNILSDVLGALLLRRTAQLLWSAGTRRSIGSVSQALMSHWVTPDTLMALYLLNPFTVASCISGSTSPIENLALLASLWRASLRDLSGAAFGVGLATYFSLHPIILLVPIALLVARGPEDCLGLQGQQQKQQQQQQQEEVGCCEAGGGDGEEGCRLQEQPAGLEEQGPGGQTGAEVDAGGKGEEAGGGQPRGSVGCGSEVVMQQGGHKGGLPWVSLLLFGGLVMCWSVCLVAASDVAVRHQPGQPCLLGAEGLGMVKEALGGQALGRGAGTHVSSSGSCRDDGSCSGEDTGADSMTRGAGVGSSWAEGGWGLNGAGAEGPGNTGTCWAVSVYRLHVLMEDLTPNIGQMWYFFTEVFSDFRPFFRFVMHALCGLFALPMALRFPQRPVLLAVAQCLILCLFKPYPSVADHALYMALLPLLQKQLRRTQSGMLLINSFLLLAVLEPAMWHQWINIESANSNFYYSITLLLGAWQVLLLVILLQLAVQVERIEQGKPLAVAS